MSFRMPIRLPPRMTPAEAFARAATLHQQGLSLQATSFRHAALKGNRNR
jgi:hypothetical protein